MTARPVLELAVQVAVRLLVVEDAHVPRAAQDVHPLVRVARVGIDGLVLLKPFPHRVPVQPDQAARLLKRRVGVPERRPLRGRRGHLDVQHLTVTAARRAAGLACGQQRRAHIGGRQVVGGIVRPLPDEKRTPGVGDELAAEVGADPLLAWLGRDAAARSLGHGGLRSDEGDTGSLEHTARLQAEGVPAGTVPGRAGRCRGRASAAEPAQLNNPRLNNPQLNKTSTSLFARGPSSVKVCDWVSWTSARTRATCWWWMPIRARARCRRSRTRPSCGSGTTWTAPTG